MGHDRLINSLTQDPSDRAALRALAAGMEDNPLLAPRAEAILRELARPAVHPDGTPHTNEQSYEYAVSFMRDALGVPEGLIASALGEIGNATLDDVATEAIEDAGFVAHIDAAMKSDLDAWFKAAPEMQQQYRDAMERLNAPRPATEPGGPVFNDPAYRLAVRGHDTKRRGEIEAAMRDDGGRRYWTHPSMQQEYGEILGRQVAPPAMPAPAPAPAAPAAPPTGQDAA